MVDFPAGWRSGFSNIFLLTMGPLLVFADRCGCNNWGIVWFQFIRYADVEAVFWPSVVFASWNDGIQIYSHKLQGNMANYVSVSFVDLPMDSTRWYFIPWVYFWMNLEWLWSKHPRGFTSLEVPVRSTDSQFYVKQRRRNSANNSVPCIILYMC